MPTKVLYPNLYPNSKIKNVKNVINLGNVWLQFKYNYTNYKIVFPLVVITKGNFSFYSSLDVLVDTGLRNLPYPFYSKGFDFPRSQ